MKIHHLLLFNLLFFFFTPKLLGQPNKPCNNYECAYKKAENFLKQAAYQKALDNLDSAEGYLTDTNTKEKEQIKQLRRRLFVAIEKEKEDAKRARDEAKRQLERALKAEKKTKSVLDKTNFYDDKFGMAYDKSTKNYGFVDKNLKTKISFIYSEALPFDYTGFARVKMSLYSNSFNFQGNYFLIDTSGKGYELSTDLKKLPLKLQALDLRNSQLIQIPVLTIQQKQNIEILFLGFNSIKIESFNFDDFHKLFYLDLSYNEILELTSNIKKLNSLHKLNLHGNKLTSLPIEIKNLENLKEIDLRNNLISKEEQEKIKKLLPNCEIKF